MKKQCKAVKCKAFFIAEHLCEYDTIFIYNYNIYKHSTIYIC